MKQTEQTMKMATSTFQQELLAILLDDIAFTRGTIFRSIMCG